MFDETKTNSEYLIPSFLSMKISERENERRYGEGEMSKEKPQFPKQKRNKKIIINKTMDLEDLKSKEALGIIDELNSLIKQMRSRNLKTSSWFGSFDLTRDSQSLNMLNRGYGYESLPGAVDDTNFPWFKYWEIVWVVSNNSFKPGQKVLDLGGSSSLFSYYLASKGLDVTTIDIRTNLVENANYVAEQSGWNLKNEVMDMRLMAVQSSRALQIFLGPPFDHITSLCVYEHLSPNDRVTLNERIKDLLVEGGKFSVTFDYQRPDRCAQINSPEDIYKQFVVPSSLKIRGNKVFFDNGKRYLLHPFYYKKRLWKLKISYILQRDFRPCEIFKTKDVNDFTFGALFLEKNE